MDADDFVPGVTGVLGHDRNQIRPDHHRLIAAIVHPEERETVIKDFRCAMLVKLFAQASRPGGLLHGGRVPSWESLRNQRLIDRVFRQLSGAVRPLAMRRVASRAYAETKSRGRA